jgi:hypothetical protein
MCHVRNPLLIVWAGDVTIDILPDNVLLHIFLFDGLEYWHRGLINRFVGQGGTDRLGRLTWTWYRLVHVCRRWRSIIFASPNFLDLRLVCLPGTRVELTGIWPSLPIIISNAFGGTFPGDFDFDAAIVHPNRVREINLSLSSLQLQRLVPAMQEQFPALIHLLLFSTPRDVSPALPDGFLGGSAPRLQSLWLGYIPFPALPKFLLSATDLVYLGLLKIPHSGYISPEAIVTCLAGMASLKSLLIDFLSPLSRPDRKRRRPPPPIRTVLPALTHFQFEGVSEYLEDFMARIDAPLLDSIRIAFFSQLIFEVPQLAQFTRRTTGIQALNKMYMNFRIFGVDVGSSPPLDSDGMSRLRILCKESDWQLSSLAQVLTPFFPSTHTLEHLYMYETFSPPQWRDDIENEQWLEFFAPFTVVKNLYLSKSVAPPFARALQGLVGSGMTEVLPTLQNIFLEGQQPSGPLLEGIGKFVAARQLSDHPITVSLWERGRDARV